MYKDINEGDTDNTEKIERIKPDDQNIGIGDLKYVISIW